MIHPENRSIVTRALHSPITTNEHTYQSCTSMTASLFSLAPRMASQASLTLYAESKKTGASFRMAALLNAGVKAFLCLCRYERGSQGSSLHIYAPLVTVSFCPNNPLPELSFTLVFQFRKTIRKGTMSLMKILVVAF